MRVLSLYDPPVEQAHEEFRFDPTLNLEPPRFTPPRLRAPTKTDLSDMSQKSVTKNIYRFGVVMESDAPEILSEVLRDVIGLVSSLPPQSQLVVVSPNATDFWERLRGSAPVSIQYGDFDSVKVWKMYWHKEKPEVPEGVTIGFEKRVGNPDRKKVILRPGTDVSAPFNKDANRMLPMGMSPNYRSAPPRGPAQMTPQMYLWSNTEG